MDRGHLRGERSLYCILGSIPFIIDTMKFMASAIVSQFPSMVQRSLVLFWRWAALVRLPLVGGNVRLVFT
jgi:hypothetical protein